jgi:hypothetical protein
MVVLKLALVLVGMKLVVMQSSSGKYTGTSNVEQMTTTSSSASSISGLVLDSIARALMSNKGVKTVTPL